MFCRYPCDSPTKDARGNLFYNRCGRRATHVMEEFDGVEFIKVRCCEHHWRKFKEIQMGKVFP